MSTLKFKVIVGSTRANRVSEKPAQWIFQIAKQRTDLDVELLDLSDYPLPFFEEAMPPGMDPKQAAEKPKARDPKPRKAQKVRNKRRHRR